MCKRKLNPPPLPYSEVWGEMAEEDAMTEQTLNDSKK